MNRPSFTFRLERVRALRERMEDQAREEFAASLSTRTRGEAMLRAACESLDLAREARRAAAARALSGTDLVATQAYLEHTERRREAAELDLDRQDAELDARREALVAASQERQVLERLKERRRVDHLAKAARAEGALLDEIGLAAHRRAEAAR